MDENLTAESLHSAIESLGAFMAPADEDPTAVMIAKLAFRLSLAIAGASVVTVALSGHAMSAEAS